MMDDSDILSRTPQELVEIMKLLGQPAFRAAQLFDWLHRRTAESYAAMDNLPKSLRERLESQFPLPVCRPERVLTSRDGTVKALFSLSDGESVEAVAMDYEHGMSVCVSSQVGCRMGCAFCASTQGGLVRCLSAGEIVAEVYGMERLTGRPADSIVLMGIGEPLDNFCNVVRFYDIITHAEGHNISNRSVSLSTCGLCDQIDRLAELHLQLTLSVSLHAPNDRKRSEIMPVNKKFPIARLMESCRGYCAATGRRISFEYAVIEGRNDGVADARELAALIKGMPSHVNLIPVNPAVRSDMRATRATASAFMEKLTKLGVNATVRRTLGGDINAACGQLRRDRKAKPEEGEQP